MLRSIGKFLIQYSYDSSSGSGLSNPAISDPAVQSQRKDRLPRWLRYWIGFDSQLRAYELELQRLEGTLLGQASGHVANGTQPRGNDLLGHYVEPEKRNLSLNSPIVLASLAAGLSCVLLVGGWLTRSSIQSSVPGQGTALELTNEPNPVRDSSLREQWLHSTLRASNRFAADIKERSGEANRTLANLNRKMIIESEQVKSMSLESLRFVSQKLPAASVRMLGLNSTGPDK